MMDTEGKDTKVELDLFVRINIYTDIRERTIG